MNSACFLCNYRVKLKLNSFRGYEFWCDAENINREAGDR